LAGWPLTYLSADWHLTPLVRTSGMVLAHFRDKTCAISHIETVRANHMMIRTAHSDDQTLDQR
jgi:hypothetical protein